MVQFSLPQNSKILKGKYYIDKNGSNNLKKVNVYRWNPSSNENPRIDTFEVDLNECGTIRTGAALATFDADINSGSVRVRATPTTDSSTVFKLTKTLTRV